MGEFTIRADSVNVEQIMQQIRARIREKRGVDYTEQQIRELATLKLERFLDAGSVRSDLLQHFRQGPKVDLPNYAFEDTTLFESHRAPIRWIRRLLKPVLKLFFNPNPLIQALHIQAKVNAEMARAFQQHAELSYEVLHNLVVELTRLGIEVRNLKMRAESLSSRLDFDERRARALENVVQHKPAGRAATPPPTEERADQRPEGADKAEAQAATTAEARTQRRRRRRRGRRNAPQQGGPGRDAEREPAAGPEGTDEGDAAAAPGIDSPGADAPRAVETPPAASKGPTKSRGDTPPGGGSEPGDVNQ